MKDLFPYETVRDKQSELKQDVEQALREGTNLVAHAPTGLGKTAATLPQCLAHSLENGTKTFFVTPRHSQHEIAVETLKEIKDRHDVNFVAADLIGKRWLCEGERGSQAYLEEDETKCPRHNNTYKDNHQLTAIAQEKLQELKDEILRAEEVKKRCDKVCPYEILMHLAAQADIVIGDYYHVFHPGVREALFSKSQITLGDTVVIVDEAHNLPGRTRNLNSATITEPMLQDAADEASKNGFYKEEEKIGRLQEELRRVAKNELGMEREVKIDKKTFKQRVEEIQDYDSLIDDLAKVAKDVREQGRESDCEQVLHFLDRWTGTDEGFVRILNRRQTNSGSYIRLSYKCLDPQYATSDPLNYAHTAIAMSGTLQPLEMYVDILGFDESETLAKAFDSPFPTENKLSLVVDKVTTQYKERDDSQYQKIAWYILKSVEEVKGNVGVFFPSYEFRNQVHRKLKDRLDRPLFLEDRRMGKEDKRKMLDQFSRKTDEGAVLLGVVGGSFGEGVDYPGDLMTAVFVVGVPLQRPDLEVQALIDFYDDKFGRGWDYGYNFPAVNRAMQAAGRCIRSSKDKGVIVYLDKRYGWSKYRDALAEDRLKLTQAPWQEIGRFFN